MGFMGSGKTTVGESLARELGWRFIDLDREIERDAGLPIASIFSDRGEQEFRRLEAQALRRTGDRDRVVLATGGGTLTRWENREFVRRRGVVVWLDAPLDVMIARCREGERRPLLGTPEAMADLYEDRLPGYRASDLRVASDRETPAELARRIAARLAELDAAGG